MERFPEQWSRALIVTAHPDDPEYGMAAAVAEWTRAGKTVNYLFATRGEAGIAGLPPHLAGPLREQEQAQACEEVGVRSLHFLDFPDGRLSEGLPLRQALAEQIRLHRPDLALTLNHRDTWGPGLWNSADHRTLGRAVFDAVSDADNEWIFPELRDYERHAVSWVGQTSTQEPSHWQPVSEASIRSAVASLSAHRRYLQALSPDPVEQQARALVDRVCAGGGIGFDLYRH